MSTDLPIQMFDFPRIRKSRERATSIKKSDTHVAVLVRMPIEQRERLRTFAKAMHRTLTGEINSRLEESLVGQSIDEHGVIVVHSSVPLK